MYQEFLTRDDLEQVHATSMRLLAKTGINFPDDEALAVWREHGVKVDGRRVYLTESQVLESLKTVPACFVLRARRPQRSVTVGDGRPVFAPGYGAPFLVDAETGKREPTLDDYERLVKLAHALPNQDLSGYLL